MVFCAYVTRQARGVQHHTAVFHYNVCFTKNNYRARGIHQFFIYFDFSSGYISVVNFKRILRGIQTLKLALSEGLFADTFVFKGVFSGFSA